MLTPQIKIIEIQGFRAFGAEKQVAHTDAPISVFWGPNSKGKTSFAEALEFLLTGKTVKKELLASRHDEFAGALRHAHLDTTTETFVAAGLHCPDGKTHLVKRTLTQDYAKQGDCASQLTVDGDPATEDDLANLGIVLSQPPLRAPVLAQHTLNYLFTVRPTDRTNYFKALLEVTDLDKFQAEVAALEAYLAPPKDPLLEKLTAFRAVAGFEFYFLAKDTADEAVLASIFMDVANSILEEEGIEVPATLEERVAGIAKRLEENRSKTFPVELFSRAAYKGWSDVQVPTWKTLSDYVEERNKVENEARRLTGLFEAVLTLPMVKDADHPVDCPVCETEKALTPARIDVLRTNVSSRETFTKAEQNAVTVLQDLRASLSSFHGSLPNLLPRFIREEQSARRESGFTIGRLEALLGEDSAGLVRAWLTTLRSLIRAVRNTLACADVALKAVTGYAKNPVSFEDVHGLKALLDALRDSATSLAQFDTAYSDAIRPLVEALKEEIDSHGDSAGLQELIDLASDLDKLAKALSEQSVYERATREVKAALKQIDDAIEAVLDQKFALLSGTIGEWWSLLRGGESTFFSEVKRRGRQTIDFKGGLSQHEDQSKPKIRDVIAVFSDSQLHCLGLAMFLARAQQYGVSFVVLDDPVLSSDEDYRVHFRGRVIQKLHELGVQVIVLTQHKATRRDIATVNDHLGVNQFQIDMPHVSQGSVISKTSDEFDTMLASVAPFTNSDDEEVRKEGGRRMRDVAERFCKKLLVAKRRANGDSDAAMSDYEDKTLGGSDGLVESVVPYLSNDPADPGKLRAIRDDVNPPSHDDDRIPTKQALKQALGNVRKFRSVYLDGAE